MKCSLETLPIACPGGLDELPELALDARIVNGMAESVVATAEFRELVGMPLDVGGRVLTVEVGRF